MEIYDIYGRFIRSFTNTRGVTQSFNVTDLPNGVYQLSIQQEEGRTTQPFIIQR